MPGQRLRFVRRALRHVANGVIVGFVLGAVLVAVPAEVQEGAPKWEVGCEPDKDTGAPLLTVYRTTRVVLAAAEFPDGVAERRYVTTQEVVTQKLAWVRCSLGVEVSQVMQAAPLPPVGTVILQVEPAFAINGTTMVAITAIVGAMAGAISFLFKLLLSSKDKQIDDLKTDNTELRNENIVLRDALMRQLDRSDRVTEVAEEATKTAGVLARRTSRRPS